VPISSEAVGDEPYRPHWLDVPAGRLVNRGHPAADHLEAYDWVVLHQAPGLLRIDAHLPAHLLNPQGQLFGGFTPTYVDLVSLHAARAGDDQANGGGPRYFMVTINMRVDYFEPIVGPRFVIEAEVAHRRGRTSLVTTRMIQHDVIATYALTTLRTTDVEL
jgi:acyl-coenzyme A thioesterase PaaI-like protein